MTASLLSMAKELMVAQIQAGQVTPEEMASVLNTTYRTLERLSAAEQGLVTAAASDGAPAWKTSIRNRTITCLECGGIFKQLSVRHLRVHGMDGRSYRAKYRIPPTQSLSARDVLRRRQAILQQSRPWERVGSKTKGKALKKAS